jgi:NADP-dependent 3-hydroxy acid dehydrogenase YdfG
MRDGDLLERVYWIGGAPDGGKSTGWERRAAIAIGWNPVALVTGGSRGVGEATARALAARGFDVAITYRNKAARAEKVRDALLAMGVRALAVGGNMVEEGAVAILFDQIQA